MFSRSGDKPAAFNITSGMRSASLSSPYPLPSVELFKGQRCFRCGGVGHKKKDCRNPIKSFVCLHYGHAFRTRRAPPHSPGNISVTAKSLGPPKETHGISNLDFLHNLAHLNLSSSVAQQHSSTALAMTSPLSQKNRLKVFLSFSIEMAETGT